MAKWNRIEQSNFKSFYITEVTITQPLDKFYTKGSIAEKCYGFLKDTYKQIDDELFLEPSAGNGSFLPYLKNFVAIDISPEGEDIMAADFLSWNSDHKNYITIGNPPFGKRSQLAIDFFNHAAEVSDVIAFILPVSFMKWSVQKQLDKNFSLVKFFYLDDDSFLANEKDYAIRTIFQVWAKKDTKFDIFEDLRLQAAPPIFHSDFNVWQYNGTEQALPSIENNWKYATYRQGYHDYNEIFLRKDYDYIKEKMTGKKKQQFFFIEPLTIESEKIILSMNFNKLAFRNTLTPGFGKGDFVSFYEENKKIFSEMLDK